MRTLGARIFLSFLAGKLRSLNGGYHRRQTMAKQNEETIKMHIDLVIYLFKKILLQEIL